MLFSYEATPSFLALDRIVRELFWIIFDCFRLGFLLKGLRVFWNEVSFQRLIFVFRIFWPKFRCFMFFRASESLPNLHRDALSLGKIDALLKNLSDLNGFVWLVIAQIYCVIFIWLCELWEVIFCLVFFDFNQPIHYLDVFWCYCIS